MAVRLEIVVGRIERLDVDAIVNPANRALIPGAGADGAIRDAAGPALSALLARKAPLPPHGAVVTAGFNLPARHIVHTAAPVWDGPGSDSAKRSGLAACYRNCIDAIASFDIESLAFPALGTGIFGWPKDIACNIAVNTVRAHRRPPPRVVFCCFTEPDADFYRAELGK